MIECWTGISDHCKGIVLITTGTILLLHSLGILAEGLSVLIAIAAIAMLTQGFIMCNGVAFVRKLFKKKHN